VDEFFKYLILIISSGDYVSDFGLNGIFIGIRWSILVSCERNYMHTVHTPQTQRDVAQSLLYAYKRAAMRPSDQDRNMLSESLCHANRILMTLALLTQPAPLSFPRLRDLT